MSSVRERLQTPAPEPSRTDDSESRDGELTARRPPRDHSTARPWACPAIGRLSSTRLVVAPIRRLDLEELPDALGAWRHIDVDELDDEPDDLRLLARLRGFEDLGLPVA